MVNNQLIENNHLWYLKNIFVCDRIPGNKYMLETRNVTTLRNLIRILFFKISLFKETTSVISMDSLCEDCNGTLETIIWKKILFFSDLKNAYFYNSPLLLVSKKYAFGEKPQFKINGLNKNRKHWYLVHPWSDKALRVPLSPCHLYKEGHLELHWELRLLSLSINSHTASK